MVALDRALGVAVAQRGPFTVPMGALDLGEIALGGAELIVAMRAPIAVEEPVGAIAVDGCFEPSRWELRGDALCSPLLPAGSYPVLVWGKNVCPALTTATIPIGGVAHASVDLVAGTPRALRLPGQFGQLEFSFADGTSLRQVHVGDGDFVRGFPGGRHHVRYEAADGTVAEADFDGAGEVGEPVVLTAARGR